MALYIARGEGYHDNYASTSVQFTCDFSVQIKAEVTCQGLFSYISLVLATTTRTTNVPHWSLTTKSEGKSRTQPIFLANKLEP